MTRTVGGLIIAVALLTAADAIVNAASCAATPISASPPTSAPASESSAPSATPTAPGPSSTAPPGRDAALDAAVQRAIDVATARGERAAVTVYDRWTATLYSAGDYLDSYSSASVMKIAIAGELLARGALADYEDTAWDMIARSNDAAADALYEMAGGDAVMVTFASRYGLDSYFGPPLQRGWWGTTRITAAGVALLLDAVADDPMVGPWLMAAMGAAECTAADGYPQCFGIAAAADDRRIKQGWSVGDPGDLGGKIHSTGFVDGDRYTVAVLTAGDPAIYGAYGNATSTAIAQVLMPDGQMV